MREQQQPFIVLPGGLDDPRYSGRREFVSAYVTDTRLMGVVGMYLHFCLPDQLEGDLHQFFYFDVEEYGFEGYDSVWGSDPERIRAAERMLLSCLGGAKVELTRREAQYLLQHYVRFNQKAQLPLPDGLPEYNFLLEHRVALSETERAVLMEKQCTPIQSPREALNYFLMRAFCKDLPALSFLSDGRCAQDHFLDHPSGILCRNHIRPDAQPDTYLCESLVEYPACYEIFVTAIRLRELQVVGLSTVNSFRISPMEAALQLARSEFVSVYEMLDPEEFTREATYLSGAATETVYENGTLFMIFHADNRHVDRWEYRLNEDVHGMYFVTRHGQLIAAAYSLDDIRMLEQDLNDAPIARRLFPSARYEFQEPVLFEFVQSDFEEFHSFVNAIRSDDD